MKSALIVDDKDENLYYLAAVLSSTGWNVRRARHGAEALTLARQAPPDLVISDLLMPVMDGYTLLRHWKADPGLRKAPFIVYTATYTEPADEALAISLGADAFMLKPLEPQDILSRIAEVTARSEPGRPTGTIEDSEDLARAYSETLIRKLEEKSLQLAELNRTLQVDIEARRRAEFALEERVKELRALHQVAALLSGDMRPDDELLASAVALIPPAMMHPDGAAARIVYGSGAYATSGFEETPWLLETPFATSDGTEGRVQIAYLREYPAADEGPFLNEERDLVTSLGEMVRVAMERRRTTEQLRDQARLLRIAGELASMGGWSLELPDGPLIWSDETCAIHDRPAGYRPTLEEALDYYHSPDRPSITADVEACIREGTRFEREYRIRTATGRLVWVYTVGEAVRDPAGRIVRLNGAFQDISDRKASEERLREQAELLDKARDAILVRDLDHRVLYWNRGAERLYGWAREEAVGRSTSELLLADRDAYHAAFEATRATGEWNGELHKRTKDGREVVIEGRWTLVRDQEGRPAQILSIDTDVTRRKQLEEQVLRVQRIESIGNLAGGIAHDLNNVLAPIIMAVGLLRLNATDPDQHELFDSIEASARRGADMVGQILSFARGTEGRKEPVRIADTIREIARLVAETFPRNVNARFEVPEDLRPVLADRTGLHQVLLNLCVNARDAMPNGGDLTVTASLVHLDGDDAGVPAEAGVGPFLRLDVVDTGAGIPEENLDRIWEPFFTTKEVGQGTGLGLATTLGIVRGHGGRITVESRLGRGTHFRVYIPAAADAAEVTVPDARVELVRGDGQLILVVDDEASIQQITRQTLEAAGYRVLVAADGAEAVALFAKHKGDVAVVLTDMMMPVMDGAATAEAVRRMDPAIPIIGASGLVGQRTSPPSGAISEFLAKPFTATILLGAVQRALAESGRR